MPEWRIQKATVGGDVIERANQVLVFKVRTCALNFNWDTEVVWTKSTSTNQWSYVPRTRTGPTKRTDRESTQNRVAILCFFFISSKLSFRMRNWSKRLRLSWNFTHILTNEFSSSPQILSSNGFVNQSHIRKHRLDRGLVEFFLKRVQIGSQPQPAQTRWLQWSREWSLPKKIPKTIPNSRNQLFSQNPKRRGWERRIRLKNAVRSTRHNLNKHWTVDGYDHPYSQNHDYLNCGVHENT
jgi:hypothetical protein